MKETETLLRFLRSTTNLSVFCWDGTEHAMVEKEQKDCFSKQAQPLLTAQGLRMVLECMQPTFLYEVEDLIGIHYLSFLFQSNPIVIGPFVSEEWNDSAADTRLTGAGIPASCLIPYKLYYCSYPLLDKHTIIQLVTGAITALCPDIPPYTYQKFSGIQNHQQQACCHNLEISDFDSAVHRYELENEFLSRIAEGQTGLALEAWHRLSKIPSADALFLDGLRGLTTNASILRTLIRKEAERCPPCCSRCDITCLCTENVFRAKCKGITANDTGYDPGILRGCPSLPCQSLFASHCPRVCISAPPCKQSARYEPAGRIGKMQRQPSWPPL